LTRAEYLVGVQTQNEDFVYDKLGNRTTLKHNGTDVARYQHNNVNEYTYIGLASGTNVTHDDAGNMTGDHDGYTYHYDYENRLTRVKKLSDTVDVAVYTYDALGRRIAVEDCIADTTTHYYYDGWRVLSETDDNDDWLRDYDYGNYIDEVLVMTDASDDHYFAHDHLFSVVALIDEDGDILEQYEYDAYGKCHFYDSSFTLLGTQKSGHGNDRLFTGQVLDILDGGALPLEYFKNRYKKDGRFITRDPLGVRDGICLVEFNYNGSPHITNADRSQIELPDTAQIAIRIPTHVNDIKHTANIGSIITALSNNNRNVDRYLMAFRNIPFGLLSHRQYIDGMNLYQYVGNNPISWTDIYGLATDGNCCDMPKGKKRCKWFGSMEMSFYALIIGGRTRAEFQITGRDINNDNCVYEVRGSGKGGLGDAAMTGIGYYSLTGVFKDVEADCEWPVNKGTRVSATFVGGGLGIVNANYVEFTIGQIKWSGGPFDVGGIHLSFPLGGGGMYAEIDKIKKKKP
jgi:hypothetical protein